MKENTTNVVFSHKSDHWQTPKEIYNYYVNRYHYVDPTPFHCEEDNSQKDFGNVNLYINPPYSDINTWVDYALNHCKKYRKKVVLLVPSRTDTKWFQNLLTHPDYDVKFAFFKGRLKFVADESEKPNSAPFPSVLITIRKVGRYGYGEKQIISTTLDDYK